MNKNSYLSLNDFKDILQVSATADDTALLHTLENSTRAIDNYCDRHFWSESATKYFDGALHLWIPDLLSMGALSASSLTTDEDGDGVFENAFSSGDFIEYGIGNDNSLNAFPITRLEISESASYGSFATGIKKGVKIVGTWGYGDGTSAPYVSDTTLSTSVSTGATASVTSAANLSAGMTILVDDEQAYIKSVSGTALTMDRGVNGTTEVVHANGTQIYYYVYPEDIRQVCNDLATAMWSTRGRRGILSEKIGDYSYTMEGNSTMGRGGTLLNKGMITNILEDSISHYRRAKV